MNLLQNALQAMPSGGTLRLTSFWNVQRRQTELEFSDTGPGISAEHRSHLFEPFFTTRSDGTGLGLALCREIVSQHGGTIEYTSGDAPGATFRIVLPSGSN
jgi:signal transduction histidine kinase